VRTLSELARPPRHLYARGMGAVAIPDATSAITSGQNTFTQAYSMAGGSLQGTAAVAAGIVANLPHGALTTALNQAMGVAGSAEAGAAIGSVIPGYGTAVGAVVGAIVGIISSITSGPPAAPEGEFRSTGERYCFPALPLTPTVGESASALAQPPLQPVVWPTYRANAVSWLPVTIDENLGNPAPSQSIPIHFTFGVGWVSPPSSTAVSTDQGYYVACAWMATNGVSRAHLLAHDDSAGDAASFGAAAKNQAITALGGTSLFNEATDLFRSWYGAGGWSTTVNGSLTGETWPPKNGDWSKSTKGYPAPQGYSGVWESMHHDLRSPQYAFDFTYYEGNYINQEEFNTWGMQFVTEDWFNTQAANRNGGEESIIGFNVAPMPDTTAIGLAELACLAVTGVIPKESADVAALHYLLGLAWMWRRGYETEKARNKTYQEYYGIDTGILEPTHDNFSRCIGLVTAKIRAADKKATTTAVKATSTNVKAQEAQILASEKAVAAAQAASATRSASLARAATIPRAAPVAAPVPAATPATTLQPEEIAMGAVALVAAAAGAVLYKKRKKRRMLT
jgi:hypothetical protein